MLVTNVSEFGTVVLVKMVWVYMGRRVKLGIAVENAQHTMD